MLTFTDTPRTEIVRGESFEDYRKAEGLNQSLLKLHDPDYDGSPDLYAYRSRVPDDTDTKARRDGRSFHTLILEPHTFAGRYRVLDRATHEAIYAEAKAEAIAAKKSNNLTKSSDLDTYLASGGNALERSAAMRAWIDGDAREIVTPEYYGHLQGMLEAIQRNGEIMDAIAGATAADCEVSAYAAHTFKTTGKSLQLKARIDILPAGDAMLDAKTCRSTNASKFAYDVRKYGYDIQADHYLSISTKAGAPRSRFGFLAIEKTPPYRCCIHWMPDAWRKYAYIVRRRILLEIAEHIRLGKWPGPPSGELMPPPSLQAEIEAIDEATSDKIAA
jgi:hypothetical protein